MARKDVHLMIDEAGRHGVTLGMMPAIATTMDDPIGHEYGTLDSCAVAQLDGRA